MKPRRLLFVLPSVVRGGAEEVVLSLLARLDRREFTLGLACPRELLDSMVSDLKTLDVETFAVRAESWLEPRQVWALARIIRSFRPDLVNSHLFRATLVAAPLAKWLGVSRVVETYHGREAWRQGIIKGSFIVDQVISYWVDRVIAVSEAARDFLVSRKNIPREKIVVIPNGRDLSTFQPDADPETVRREFGVESGTPLLSTIGRLEPQKGHEFLLQAFKKVAAEFTSARLLLAGDGSLKQRLQERSKELGISSQVIFAGFRSDVHRILDATDLVVLPSIYEGMPLAAIEAAAMAKPIVATCVDGTAEVVQDGINGRLVPPADPEALSEAMLVSLRNMSEARSMARIGQCNALERFDIDRQVEATAEVYREVLDGE